jgi:hypothetical protein
VSVVANVKGGPYDLVGRRRSSPLLVSCDTAESRGQKSGNICQGNEACARMSQLAKLGAVPMALSRRKGMLPERSLCIPVMDCYEPYVLGCNTI